MNESSAVLGLPSALLWSGNVLHANTHDRGNNPNNSGNEGKGNTTITQTLDRMWTVLDQHGRAKNLKASKSARRRGVWRSVERFALFGPVAADVNACEYIHTAEVFDRQLRAHEVHSHRGNRVVLERGKFGGETLRQISAEIFEGGGNTRRCKREKI